MDILKEWEKKREWEEISSGVGLREKKLQLKDGMLKEEEEGRE